MGKTLVAYFSASGVTKKLSQTLADSIGADLFAIWWYVAPTIVNTFLESCDLTGKTVVPFATSGGSGMGGTNKALAPSCTGARLLEGKVFRSSTNADTLREWVKTLK